MKRIVFLLLAAVFVFAGCKKEFIEPAGKNTVDTVYVPGGNNGNNGNTGGWVYAPSNATFSGNEFTWNLSNSSLNPTGREIFVVWIGSNGVVNYNKLSEGVAGVFTAGTVSNGIIKFSLDPAYGKLKFNLAVNGGPPSNQWYWFTAQGTTVQYPCQHMSGSWCFDDGLNNLFSVSYSGSTWIPANPC